jgi:hypothetical protein
MWGKWVSTKSSCDDDAKAGVGATDALRAITTAKEIMVKIRGA